jgi:hypothetical protein
MEVAVGVVVVIVPEVAEVDVCVADVDVPEALPVVTLVV